MSRLRAPLPVLATLAVAAVAAALLEWRIPAVSARFPLPLSLTVALAAGLAWVALLGWIRDRAGAATGDDDPPREART